MHGSQLAAAGETHDAKAALREILERVLCIQRFPSTCCERHQAPEVETRDVPQLLLDPVNVVDNQVTYYIESSINSMRLSIRLQQEDDLQRQLVKMLMRFLMRRADQLDILRRVPLDGYDISFLVTDRNLLRLGKVAILDFLCSFAEQVSAETEMLKQGIRSQGKTVANEFLRALAF